jgi:hypothetical protein
MASIGKRKKEKEKGNVESCFIPPIWKHREIASRKYLASIGYVSESLF